MTSAQMLARTTGSLVPALGFAAAMLAAGCGGPPRGDAARRGIASVPAARPADHGEPRPAARSYLQDDYERIFPERVRLARYGEVRYAAREAGDAAGDGERSDLIEMAESPTLVVVDQVGDRVRVVAPQDHHRLLLWIDVDDLYTVVNEAVALSADSASAAAAHAATGIRLHPGLPVEIEGERGAMAHVRHRDGCVSFSGWVPRGVISTQFVPNEASASDANAQVGAGSTVLERPGGRVLARFLSDCAVTDTGPEVDGFRPIRYVTEWFELRGWVAIGTAKVAPGGNTSSWGYGLGHLGLLGSTTRFRLAEGTCLYARRGGPSIGVVTEDAEAPASATMKGWWQVPLETGWGDLTVWVAEERGRQPEPSAPPKSDAGAARADDDESGGDDELRPFLRRCR
jgi:hypothetical protein